MRIDGAKLVYQLAKKEMTQTQLAELTELSRATINYVRGGKRCSDETGKKIADALGVDVTEILED